VTDIVFTKEQKELLVHKVKLYFMQELDDDIGQFDAEFLLDFISKETGAYYYNKGLQDAQITMQNQMDTLTDALYVMEKPIL